MTTLVIGLILFLGVHTVSIAAPAWRDAAVSRLGEGTWKALYSLASLAGFVLLVYGYGLARQQPTLLYAPPEALRYVALLLLLPVFPLLFAVYLPGRIKTAAKHPMLLATKLWALAHLLTNGNAADVLLFGGFLAWAVADRVSLKRRPARPVPSAPASPKNDVIAVLGGLVLYALFLLWAHAWLMGVSPIRLT
ncbi:MAG: NnrU family protein [Burkholderiaceae bacterium]|nr:NnrU family protein [Burkholderiaceae bacterium]